MLRSRFALFWNKYRPGRTVLFALALAQPVGATGQPDQLPPELAARFPAIDARAVRQPFNGGDLVRLTDSLAAPYSTELEQARAIFAWISEYIAYDCGSENRLEKEPDEAVDPLNYTQVQLENILRTRRTRCDGYAFLFKLMCNLAGIYCTVLEGYARFSGRQVDPATVQPNHAWNAARLDGRWYEIDPTVGSGHCEGRRFRRQRTEQYFGMSEDLIERLYIPVEDSRRSFNQGRINLKH